MDDLISREKAFSYFVTLWECIGTIMDRDEWEDVCLATANEIPSAQPEHRFDEWCTECKEYDHERHCCPRFNQVIRTTLKEVQEERKKGEWIAQKGGGYCCSECGSYSLDEVDGAFVHVSVRTRYCHNCGAKMEKKDE